MELIKIVLAVILYFIFWIIGFVVAANKSQISFWGKNLLQAIAVCGGIFLVGKLVSPAGIDGLGHAVFTIGAMLVVFFIWGLATFAWLTQKSPSDSTTSKQGGGREDILDDEINTSK